MESLSDLKRELTEWMDARIKVAVDEGNKDLMQDLDLKFQSVEDSVNQVSRDVAGVSNSVADLVNAALRPITDAINRLNPFHL